MDLFTIGELGKQINERPSTLRFYEQEGLLQPEGRSPAGYRLYSLAAVETVRFIQRAQRLGFSLDDIRTLLRGDPAQPDAAQALLALAEKRYLALERQITGLLIRRHELEELLRDLSSASPASPLGSGSATAPFNLYERLLERICPAVLDAYLPQRVAGGAALDEVKQRARIRLEAALTALDWLFIHTGCRLNGGDAHAALAGLAGRHIHLWQEQDTVHILVVDKDPAVECALNDLARLEAGCSVHPLPEVRASDEGYLFVAQGENAFLYARLFLALEGRDPAPRPG